MLTILQTRILSGRGKEFVPHFPVIPVSEVIANALIQQDLTARGAGPLTELLEDRTEVLNPGVPLFDSKLFIYVNSTSRNEALAALLRRF